VQLGLHATAAQVAQKLARLADQVGVEGAGQPAVAGEHQHGGAPGLLRLAEDGVALRQLGVDQPAHHVGQPLGVGAGGGHAVLRALQLGRGHHLHRPRDLARVLDRADAAL
jgi:hypothetical protein